MPYIYFFLLNTFLSLIKTKICAEVDPQDATETERDFIFSATSSPYEY